MLGSVGRNKAYANTHLFNFALNEVVNLIDKLE